MNHVHESYLFPYSSVEISPALAEIQKQTVGEVRSHQSKFKVECRDATDKSGWGRSPSVLHLQLFEFYFRNC